MDDQAAADVTAFVELDRVTMTYGGAGSGTPAVADASLSIDRRQFPRLGDRVLLQ